MPKFVSDITITDDTKKKFFREFPECEAEYKEWSYWDSEGYPMPNPAELEGSIPDPEADDLLNAPDDNEDEE